MNEASLTPDPAPSCPQRILCVLGMHRSGTSCLTGSLQEAGLSLGECHTWNPHNLKGNRENQQIVDINDAVLAAADCAWDTPPGSDLRWPEAQRREVLELFAGYADQSPFGFKDPRTLLVLEGWRELLPHMQFVGIFRQPVAVAQSLHNRSGMPHEQGLALWYQYNRRLLRFYRQQTFPLLCFDESEGLFREKLRAVLSQLGFASSAWQGDFYDGELKSSPASDEITLPWQYRRLYRKLRRLAE